MVPTIYVVVKESLLACSSGAISARRPIPHSAVFYEGPGRHYAGYAAKLPAHDIEEYISEPGFYSGNK